MTQMKTFWMYQSNECPNAMRCYHELFHGWVTLMKSIVAIGLRIQRIAWGSSHHWDGIFSAFRSFVYNCEDGDSLLYKT